MWWDIILGRFSADGGGLEEGVKSADGRRWTFLDAWRPITESLMREILVAWLLAEWHKVVTGLWLWLMEGSSSNNRKQTAEAECVVLQGYPHLHETLSRHQRRIYGFYSGRLLLNKCNAMSAKCCANLKLMSSTCEIGFLPEPYCLLNTFSWLMCVLQGNIF